MNPSSSRGFHPSNIDNPEMYTNFPNSAQQMSTNHYRGINQNPHYGDQTMLHHGDQTMLHQGDQTFAYRDNQGNVLHEYSEGIKGGGPSQHFPQGPALFGNPLMTDVAFMYGSSFVDSGKEIMDKELNKYISLPRLKKYFMVDTFYTIKKLNLLLFPYYNSNWAPKIVRGEVGLPIDDVNAPDLYIPLMAYVTFVLLAGVVLGTHSMFSPEVLGVIASQALVCVLIELVIQVITIYITNLQAQNFCTWDLLAFSGYKFVGVNVAVLLEKLFGRLGYYCGLIFCGTSLSFYLLRSLKWRMVNESAVYPQSNLGKISVTDHYQGKRRLYFLLSIALSQPLLMWWLSYNLNFNQSNLKS